MYESPKNLVHKSAVSKKFKETFEVKEFRVVGSRKRTSNVSTTSSELKKPKQESVDERQEVYNIEGEHISEHFGEVDEADQEGQSVSIMILPHDIDESMEAVKPFKPASSARQEPSQEDKFIREVYPQFKGKTKLQLIEDIIELRRLNELLQDKAKNYEKTINRLLS